MSYLIDNLINNIILITNTFYEIGTYSEKNKINKITKTIEDILSLKIHKLFNIFHMQHNILMLQFISNKINLIREYFSTTRTHYIASNKYDNKIPPYIIQSSYIYEWMEILYKLFSKLNKQINNKEFNYLN